MHTNQNPIVMKLLKELTRQTDRTWAAVFDDDPKRALHHLNAAHLAANDLYVELNAELAARSTTNGNR